jgi:hypothetical protein
MIQSQAWHRGCAVFLIACCLSILIACDGGESSPGPVTADTQNVDIGIPLQAGDWKVELLKPPEKIKVMGKGDITYQAEGEFLVVFAKVNNHGQVMQVVGRDLFIVRDGKGQEYNPVKSAVQIAYVLQHGMEPSLDSPLAAGESRDSVVIFDVPSDATGLTLGLAGTQDILKLGF